MPVPPRANKSNRSFLDDETHKIDALIAKIREGIETLKEYRTALISAAVTGKIDVRRMPEARLASLTSVADRSECSDRIPWLFAVQSARLHD